MNLRPAILATVACATLVVAGCGATTPQAGAPGAVPSPTAAPSAPAGWRLSAADKELLERSEDVLAQQCMRGLGYKYWTAPAGQVPAGWGLPYVIDDPVWARQHGYGGADERSRDEQAGQDPNRKYVSGLSQTRQTQYNVALFGPTGGASVTAKTPAGDQLVVGTSGCLAKARSELYGDLRTWFTADTVVSNLQPLVAAEVTADPRYKRGLASWAACARQSGFHVSSPEQLQAAVPAHDDERERQYAVVEATCAVRTGFGALVRALDRQDRTLVETQYAGPVRTLRGLQYRALETAHKFTGQPAGTN